MAGADTQRNHGRNLFPMQQLGQGFVDLFYFLMDHRRINGMKEDNEFIAADPADQIILAEAGF